MGSAVRTGLWLSAGRETLAKESQGVSERLKESLSVSE